MYSSVRRRRRRRSRQTSRVNTHLVSRETMLACPSFPKIFLQETYHTGDGWVSWLSSKGMETDNYWVRGSFKTLKPKIAPEPKNHNMKTGKEPWRQRKGHKFYNSTLGGSGSQLHAPAALSWVKKPRYPTDSRLGGSQSPYGHDVIYSVCLWWSNHVSDRAVLTSSSFRVHVYT